MTDANLQNDLEPRSQELPFKLCGKSLIVRELPLYQRKRVITLLCSAATKLAGVAQQASKESVLGTLASGDMDQIVKTLADVLGDAVGEFDAITYMVLACTENAKALGLIEQDALFCHEDAAAKLAEAASYEMTTRMQLETLKAYFEVEGLGELLGNLQALPEKVESLVGSETETTD